MANLDRYFCSYEETISKMNAFGKRGEACLFVLDYDKKKGLCLSLEEVKAQDEIMFEMEGYSYPNPPRSAQGNRPQIVEAEVEPYETYQARFEQVMTAIRYGNSFLLNLSIRTPIKLSHNLSEIYQHCSAPYKLLLQGYLLSFSPECFVKIKDDKISTYPMKGTIDASLPKAKEELLNSYKESCEHTTIVDLMRNDLNQVAKRVKLERYKFLSLIETSKGAIWQMSSEVVGRLAEDWQKRMGTLFDTLLPAGSISGAPKPKTCEVIYEAEGRRGRGFYTGVWGVFDGKNLNSAVLIRFVEESEGRHYYHSGGGITINSNCKEEYDECIKKIYLPIR